MGDDVGPPAAKRARHGRSLTVPLLLPPHRHMLRSSAAVVHVELPPPQRKRPIKINLVDLNDDCLLKMFQSLEPIDLRAVSQVNIRLYDLVDYYARLKYKLHLPANASCDFGTAVEQPNFSAARTYLMIFGHAIDSLVCKHQSDLENYYRVMFSDRGDWFKRCNIKFLVCENLYDQSKLLEFTRLVELRVHNTNFDNSGVEKIVRQNRSLKTLSVINGAETSTYSFKSIARLENLEDLEFKKWRQARDITEDLMHLLKLKKLKTLKLGFASTTCTYSPLLLLEGFVENCIPIEHLELENGSFEDGSASAIAQLKTINVLKLNRMIGLNEAHLVHIAKELEFVEVLHVRVGWHIADFNINGIVNAAHRLNCFKIDANGFTLAPEGYQELLATLQIRPTQIKLKLWIYGDESPPLIDDQIQHEQWLAVHHLNRHSNVLFEDLKEKYAQRDWTPRPQDVKVWDLKEYYQERAKYYAEQREANGSDGDSSSYDSSTEESSVNISDQNSFGSSDEFSMDESD